MGEDLDGWLRIVAASAYSRSTDELLSILHRYRSSGLPSFEPLLIRAQEVLRSRYQIDRVNHLLGSQNVPRRDTIVKNTGYKPK